MPDVSVVAKLRATSAVTALLGSTNACRCGHIDQMDTYPAIAVTADREPVTHASGSDTTEFATVDIDCAALTYNEARALMLAVRDAIAGYTNADGSPSISMTNIEDIAYIPGPPKAGRDKRYEVFRVTCHVQYSTA